jgi:hypothetical protein
MIRCFKCPKERRGDDPGWYFMDLHDRHTGIARLRVYVCPRDYLLFAESERVRWTPILDLVEDDVAARPADLPVLAGCGAGDLITVLSLRGMTGWALLVRDVAEGRIRRLHLRQLPADPQIRQALVAYLQSAGAEITVSWDLMPGSLGAIAAPTNASAD